MAKPDRFSDEETARRLAAILEGAFAGPPTPLKDIPTQEGKRRKLGPKTQRRRLDRQRKKRAA